MISGGFVKNFRSTLLLGCIAAIALLGCSKKESVSESIQHVPDRLVIQCDSVLDVYASSRAGNPDYDAVKRILDGFLSLHPKSTELRRYCQDVITNFDRYEDALAAAKSDWEANQNSAMFAYLYGRLLKVPQEQITLYHKATELDPSYFWGWYALGATLSNEQVHDTASAIESYKRAIGTDRTQPHSYRFLGLTYKARGEIDSALVYLGLFSLTEPDKLASLEPKTDLLSSVGRFEEAEAMLSVFATAHPDDYECQRALAELGSQRGMHSEAIPHIYGMLDLARNRSDAHHRLMAAFCAAGSPDSAFIALQRAIGDGFSEPRIVLYDPALEPVRQLPVFAPLKAALIAGIDSTRMERDAERAKDREKRKADALATKIDRPAPDFSLVDMYGNSVSLSSLQGQVVVLDFWATWCSPCRMTMPLLQEFHDARSTAMAYYAVNIWQADTSEVRPYLAKYGYTFNTLFGRSKTATDFGIVGIPTLLVIDKSGHVRYEHSGYQSDMDEALSWQLDDLL
jgi:thiol-disulfide isomerase/thioredoxin